MKRKVTSYFLICLLAVLLTVLPGCSSASKATLTNQQVVVIISVSAVPAIDHYLEQNGQTPLRSLVRATGDWDAVHTGDGIWRVYGPVITGYPGPEKNCSTTWTFNEIDGTIKLVSIMCE